jgi:ATP-dependent phosphofructokinase / diphosphate-dependent phosphofructokinase
VSSSNFSIVAVAEGALSREDAPAIAAAVKRRKQAQTLKQKRLAKEQIRKLEAAHVGNTMRLAAQLEKITQLEARVTILGYVQRGGTPSAADRLLATQLGTACAELIQAGKFGVMVAARGDGVEAVSIEQVAGKLKTVPADHPWIHAARRVGTCLGD